MSHTVTIRNIEPVTHDVKRFTFDRPQRYNFIPGQATEVSIDKEGWRDKKRPFTFTSLADDPYLEFTVKIYEEHNGVTNQLGNLHIEDRLIIREPWGTIQYKGPGVFLAGGAGVTPFIAILRSLYQDEEEMHGNKLIFSNKTEQDIILKDEFEAMFGPDFINVITDEPTDKYINLNGFIDKKFLEHTIDNFDQPFYVCGPPPFIDAMLGYLKELGADAESLVFEE
ncbi:MAG TPA: FAD-binding oxidoreductase [Balneolaceae bacterium]